ncbi:MAG TPA: hypothetical protein VFO31_10405 [Vicinamibacterales bacterium]|nr:hypothetical protein [Vicinamibacterales bacterium]
MIKLVDVFPALANQLAQSLRAEGLDSLAEQVNAAVVQRVTFDESVNAGYIHVVPARALNVVEANIIGVRHGRAIDVETEYGAVIDIDNFERLSGIEILAPGVLAAELKRRARKE